MKKRILALLLSAMLLLGMAGGACSSTPVIDIDREGNPINLPDKVERVISLGPSNTEILVALGCADKIIAADTYSNLEGLQEDIPLFSMLPPPDSEQIINLEPDVVFVTGMVKAGDVDDPFMIVAAVGFCVVYIPSSTSIAGIYDDIRFIASVMGEKKAGDRIVSDMQKEIKAIKAIGEKISDKKTVYFEVGAAPYTCSLGIETFQNEMLELIGAVNIFNGQKGWFSVSDEAVLDANPDVILTTCTYMFSSSSTPMDEIKARSGWGSVTAVKNNDVYYIDENPASQPCQNIIKALWEMARVIYPDKY